MFLCANEDCLENPNLTYREQASLLLMDFIDAVKNVKSK